MPWCRAGSLVIENAPSTFTKELINELTRDHYRLHAWRRFMSRSWARSLEDIRKSPSLTRSFLLWASAFALMGFSLAFLAWQYHPRAVVINSLVLWLPWYAASVVFVLTHLGMADDGNDVPHSHFLSPNRLSFMRLSLAPLVLLPCLAMPTHPLTSRIFTLFIVAMSLSDVLDGWLARRQKLCTRLGQMLDYLGDLALLTFLAFGLYLASAIPGSLLWLMVVRYPLSMIGVLVLYFVRGPAPLIPTMIGRLTTLAATIVLLVIAFRLLLTPDLPPALWVDWLVVAVQPLLAANIIYLIYRGVAWQGSTATTNETLRC